MVLIFTWVSKVCWHQSKVDSCLHSGVALKDSGEGKSSQWAEFQAVHLMSTLSEGEMA